MPKNDSVILPTVMRYYKMAKMQIDVKEINDRAMELLSDGKYDPAQQYFYEGKNRFPCAQTYNNLGLFLYENGISLRNGKCRAAKAIGKKYVAQALEIMRDPIILYNYGRMLFDEGDY
ncbi:MAG: hypothetical protein ILO68_02085, partial [Clostridia bacterium]|nr:hypothetical protein [Clostridia bacterium]